MNYLAKQSALRGYKSRQYKNILIKLDKFCQQINIFPVLCDFKKIKVTVFFLCECSFGSNILRRQGSNLFKDLGIWCS